MVRRIVQAPLRFKARLAGALYFIAVAMGACGEAFVRGRLGFGMTLVAISCNVAVTLLICSLFKETHKILVFLAAVFNLVGLAFEARQWYPRGVVIAMVFHALYCLTIGCLVSRSRLLPRLLGLLMALAGVAWLVFLSPPLSRQLSPYNVVIGFLGEGLFMLWLLTMGVRIEVYASKSPMASTPLTPRTSSTRTSSPPTSS